MARVVLFVLAALMTVRALSGGAQFVSAGRAIKQMRKRQHYRQNDALSAFTEGELERLSFSPVGDHVSLTGIPSPWVRERDFEVAPHLLGVHANRLWDRATILSLSADLFAFMSAATAGVGASMWIQEKAGYGWLLGSGAIFAVASVVRVSIVGLWRAAAEEYRSKCLAYQSSLESPRVAPASFAFRSTLRFRGGLSVEGSGEAYSE